jgi:hypothetical protein
VDVLFATAALERRYRTSAGTTATEDPERAAGALGKIGAVSRQR